MAGVAGAKYLTRARLEELLATLPDDVRLSTNVGGNLSITNADGSAIGYIDFRTEKIELSQRAYTSEESKG